MLKNAEKADDLSELILNSTKSIGFFQIKYALMQ
jgi:hypothetical protein